MRENDGSAEFIRELFVKLASHEPKERQEAHEVWTSGERLIPPQVNQLLTEVRVLGVINVGDELQNPSSEEELCAALLVLQGQKLSSKRVGPVVDLLTNPQPLVRYRALLVLQHCELNYEQIFQVAQCLDDPYPMVKRAAYFAMQGQNLHTQHKAFIEKFERENGTTLLRELPAPAVKMIKP